MKKKKKDIIKGVFIDADRKVLLIYFILIILVVICMIL